MSIRRPRRIGINPVWFLIINLKGIQHRSFGEEESGLFGDLKVDEKHKKKLFESFLFLFLLF